MSTDWAPDVKKSECERITVPASDLKVGDTFVVEVVDSARGWADISPVGNYRRKTTLYTDGLDPIQVERHKEPTKEEKLQARLDAAPVAQYILAQGCPFSKGKDGLWFPCHDEEALFSAQHLAIHWQPIKFLKEEDA